MSQYKHLVYLDFVSFIRQSWSCYLKDALGFWGGEEILPFEILEKAMWHPLEIPKQNNKIDRNSTWYFLDHCWKFHFFLNWPLEFQHALSLIRLEIPCPQPPYQVFSPLQQPKICLSPGKTSPPVDPTPTKFLSPIKVNSLH